MDNKDLSQLLLSPLFLFNHILGVLAPGALLILLIALKGNKVVEHLWLQAPLGYKTKVAVFVLFAYIAGSVLKLPISLISAFTKRFSPTLPFALKGQSEEVSKMLRAIVTDGAILSMPGLMDRLSLFQADAGFHFGAGMALLIAAMIPGDGILRLVELALGGGMCWAGIRKARTYTDEAVGLVGIGLANVVARMSPQQFSVASAIFKGLGIAKDIPQATIGTSPSDPIQPKST